MVTPPRYGVHAWRSQQTVRLPSLPSSVRKGSPRRYRPGLAIRGVTAGEGTYREGVPGLPVTAVRRGDGRPRMALKIMPHGRLQEWVAEEKGYFAAEGLEYSFVLSEDYGVHRPRRDDAGEIRTGAFETFGAGRDGADVSCACHWATSAAASERSGRLVTTAYSVAPCAVVVPPESPIRRPEELAGVPIGVGYHSGSHFATVQALEAVLPPGEVTLSFQGPPNERLDALLQRQVPAATAWGVPLYIAEAFGFRKIVDATFMIGFLVTGRDVSRAEVDKYLGALRRAQMEIDLHPERYKHYHLRAVPEKYRDQVDVRSFGTGERIVFLPYPRESFAATREWTEAHQLFADRPASLTGYDEAALVLRADHRGACSLALALVRCGSRSAPDVRVRDRGELADQRRGEEDEPERDLVEPAQLAAAGGEHEHDRRRGGQDEGECIHAGSRSQPQRSGR